MPEKPNKPLPNVLNDSDSGFPDSGESDQETTAQTSENKRDSMNGESMESEDGTPESGIPGFDRVSRFLLYSLSVPERDDPFDQRGSWRRCTRIGLGFDSASLSEFQNLHRFR